jgi:outer membrane immunogenic protein
MTYGKILVAGVAAAALGSALGSALSSPALGGDLPPAVYLANKAPVAVLAPYSWTGFYVGGEVGAKAADTTWSTTAITDPAFPGQTVDASSPMKFDPMGVRAGGYAGYNWQFAPHWVTGIEGDIAWADKAVTAAGIPGCALPVANSCTGTSGLVGGAGPGADLSSVALGWDASLRARLGFLVMPQVLLYGTGGVAWQELKASATCQHSGADPICLNVAGNPFATATNSTVRTGWTLGGGVETVLYGNWLVRGEYRFADFGTWNNTLNLSVPGAGDSVQLNLRAVTHTGTVGLAYKF